LSGQWINRYFLPRTLRAPHFETPKYPKIIRFQRKNMRSHKILVFGRFGQIAWELRRELACLGHVTTIGYPQIDFNHPDTIRKAVQNAEPTVIVNAAAYTEVDKAETNFELASTINSTAPGVLAEESKRRSILLVHYSTDYVFDGSKQGAYVETDVPNPISAYGKTKLAGDQAIESVGGEYLILRTSWIYGARGNNFLLTMLRLARERSELRIVDDQIGAPTPSQCIAQATANILAQVLSPGGAGLDGRGGIYNTTSSGETSWFGFAKALLTRSAEYTGLAIPSLIPIATSGYPRPARRPPNSRLSCQRLSGTFGVRIPHWEDALSLVLESLLERPDYSRLAGKT
jgi:dTDP-4-dehydrorhamnose reductase